MAQLRTPETAPLDECVNELMQLPGTIQPHGALLAVDPLTFDVLHASSNCGAVLGVEAEDLLNRSLACLAGADLPDRLRNVLAEEVPSAVNPVSVHVQDEPFDVIVHQSGAVMMVEFERADPLAADLQSMAAVYGAIQRLARASTVSQLREETVRVLRGLVEFDRVVLYHFHENGHAEVVAEDRTDDIEPHLGLHYPAAAIPAQARRLYIRKPSRLIVTADYEPVALLHAPSLRVKKDIDLSEAQLRGASPHQLQIMRRMGWASAFSLSLIHNGELIGMITCAHPEPRHIPYRLRQGCEILANQVALRLSAMSEIRKLTRRMQIQAVRARLLEQLNGGEEITDALLRGPTTLLDLVSADGATLCLDEHLVSIGDTPPKTEISALLSHLGSDGKDASLSTDALAAARPDLTAVMPSKAGITVLPFGSDANCIVWFRSEILHGVERLGGRSTVNSAALSSGDLFSMWRERVAGRAAPWDALEVSEATELCRDLANILLRRAELRLANLGEDLKRTLAESRRKELLLQTVMDTVDVGVVVVDEDAGDMLMNAQQEIYHRLASPDGTIDTDEVNLLVYGPDGVTPLPAAERPVERAALGQPFSDQVIWIGPAGEQKALRVSARPVKGAANFRGSIVAFSDVTGLVNAVTAKEDFVANVSHELRTPLTSIIGYLDLVLEEDGQLPDGAAASLRVVLRNAEKLLHLVSDLLCTAAGRSSLEQQRTNVAEIVRSCVLSAAPRAKINSVEFVVEAPAALAATVDPERITQVLDNLLSNAIKYSPLPF